MFLFCWCCVRLARGMGIVRTGLLPVVGCSFVLRCFCRLCVRGVKGERFEGSVGSASDVSSEAFGQSSKRSLDGHGESFAIEPGVWRRTSSPRTEVLLEHQDQRSLRLQKRITFHPSTPLSLLLLLSRQCYATSQYASITLPGVHPFYHISPPSRVMAAHLKLYCWNCQTSPSNIV